MSFSLREDSKNLALLEYNGYVVIKAFISDNVVVTTSHNVWLRTFTRKDFALALRKLADWIEK